MSSLFRCVGTSLVVISIGMPILYVGRSTWMVAAIDAWVGIGLWALGWAVETFEIRRRSTTSGLG